MICIRIGLTQTGTIGAATFQSDGRAGFVFAPTAADSAGKCPVGTYVLQEQADIEPSPFAISQADAVQIGAAIAACWLLAFGFRAVRNTLNSERQFDETP